MPWTAKDADSHTKKADTPEKKKKWAAAANSAREKALKDGKSEKEADAAAIRIANSSLGESLADAVEPLSEYFANDGVKPRVDREAGIIYGVKMLGLQSRNKGYKHYAYPPATHSKSFAIMEGVVSNVDHHDPSKGERVSYRDRIGVFRNVQATDTGTFGDYHVNPKHSLAEQLFWDAENAPEKLGFSIRGDGKINRKDPKHPIVEEIVSVSSVDLVANPATTHGLFESEDVPDDQLELCEHGLSAVSDARQIILSHESIETKKSRLSEVLAAWQEELAGGPIINKENSAMEWTDITVESLKEHRNDIVAVLTGTDEVSKLNVEITGLKESLSAKDAELAAATSKIAAAEAEKAATAKTIAISEELKAAHLDASDKAVCSETFMETLSTAPDAAARKRLIEDRVAIVKPRHHETPPFATMTTGQSQAASGKDIKARLR
jgi:hypothetical protein